MAHPSTSTSLSKEDLYLSDIITGAHGDKYQKDLALLIFERATRKGYNFLLGYEMAIADKFDDVVFFNKGCEKWTLIQTKHADISKGKSPVKFDMLFPKDEGTREKGDFSLFKYFKSYVSVQANIKEQKNVIIFSNRDLLINSLEQSVDVEPRKVDDILVLDSKKPQQVGLKVNEHLIKEMVDYVNRDFNLLRDGIVKLFKEGITDQVVKNLKTPVASILSKTNNTVKFLDSTPSEANQMLESLREFIDTKTAEVSLNKCKDLFTGKSRSKTWPLYTNVDTAHQFFQDLILFIAQPDDLTDIIDHDMHLWMRTWIRPQYFIRLEEPQLEIVSSLEKFCNQKQSTVKTNADSESSYKKFLKCHDGEEFFDIAKNILKKQIYNLANYNDNPASDYYINRRIEYIMHSDEKTRNETDAEKIIKMRISDDNFVNELYGKFNNQSFLLLTAEPGMGKSTILEHIAMTAQKNSSELVYLFNLNTLDHKLEKVTEIRTIDDFLPIFVTVLSQANFNNLYENIVCNKENIKYLMIFDAFDEIHPQNRTKVLKIFEHLLNVTNVKIIVSARRSIKTSIENARKVKSMSLVSFNEQDKLNFLRKYWKVSEENESRFQLFVTQLINILYSKSSSALLEFTGLPLILKMLAEVYADNLKKFLASEKMSEESILTDMINIINLYEQFVRKSFVIKMIKKYNSFRDSDDERNLLFTNFTSEHQLFAIKYLQIVALQNVLIEKEHAKTLEAFEKRLISGTEKSPLVEAVDNDSRFIHRSYAEFLVAKFLIFNIEKYEAEVFVNYSMSSHLAKDFEESIDNDSPVNFFDQYPMIRMFFFAMVEEQFEAKYLEILERYYKKNCAIALWACEVHGLKTVERLLRNVYEPTIVNRLLHVAAEHNCPGIFSYLFLNHQVVVDFQIDESTSLHIAAAKGHADVVEMLIKNAANIEAITKYDETPLHVAVANGHSKVVEILIQNAANIEAYKTIGKTPLYVAVENGHSNVVEILIKNAAKIDEIGYLSRTPLHYAAEKGHSEIVEILLKNAANIEAKDNLGKTPLHYAVENGQSDTVEILIQNAAYIEAKKPCDETPLHVAVEKGHSEVVEILIKNAANIEAKTACDETPLHVAVENGHSEVVEILIKNAANIAAKGQLNKTPLHYAVEKGHSEIVKILIKNAANIEAKKTLDETPLYVAAENGHSEVVKMLIDKLANTNAKGFRKLTPLHIAAQKGYTQIVNLLIAHSADIGAVDDNGLIPLSYAIKNDHTEIIRILTEHGKTKAKTAPRQPIFV